jgi:elongator complex protein 3
MLNIKKPVRTISGVTPLTVVLKPKKCDHGTCIYCPGGDSVPQSYTDKSPAIMRALALGFDPYKQVKNRLKVLNIMGHPTDKIELIVLGGTFLQYDLDYQYNFIKRCFDAFNGRNSRSLEKAKKLNEKAKHRCVAMCIENRPDNCSEEEIERMLEFGTTRVEIGIQMPDNEIYQRINRGHTVEDVIEATERLKNAGFKVGYHVMPGLPGSNMKKDLEMFKKIFDDNRFRPDQLKIYPCQIVEGAPLAKIYRKIKYKPYTEEETKKIVSEMMKIIPEYCRVMRVIREFPKETLVKGLIRLDLRKDVERELRDRGVDVKEIRMREVGFNPEDSDLDLRLRILEYKASNGREFFIQLVNKNNILFGLLRLRLTRDRAMIRELHVYGQALKLGEKGKISQHTGLGKRLMLEAEKIAREKGYDKISVISGIGVREYYRKIGYRVLGPYMVKNL